MQQLSNIHPHYHTGTPHLIFTKPHPCTKPLTITPVSLQTIPHPHLHRSLPSLATPLVKLPCLEDMLRGVGVDGTIRIKGMKAGKYLYDRRSNGGGVHTVGVGKAIEKRERKEAKRVLLIGGHVDVKGMVGRYDYKNYPTTNGVLFTATSTTTKTVDNGIRSKNDSASMMKMKKKDVVYRCGLCTKDFDKKWRLESHIRVLHRNIRRFGCEKCHKRFPYASDLKKHRLEVHLGLRPHVCPTCCKGFAAMSKLKAHCDSVHLKKRPHVCGWDGCGKRFGYKSDLTKHLRKLHGVCGEELKKFRSARAK